MRSDNITSFIVNRMLDLVPNDPDTVASEAKIYQAEGNLEHELVLRCWNLRKNCGGWKL